MKNATTHFGTQRKASLEINQRAGTHDPVLDPVARIGGAYRLSSIYCISYVCKHALRPRLLLQPKEGLHKRKDLGCLKFTSARCF